MSVIVSLASSEVQVVVKSANENGEMVPQGEPCSSSASCIKSTLHNGPDLISTILLASDYRLHAGAFV